ncbi:MAG: hypothetical protein WAQ53_07935 [Thiofilum sp.]|uniref:hypothetical protein n=1 Tax=Thiofilum sp. TaxID=2212733 RepID=UPI0025F9FA42|nr:hypothetical protein [Thiofilum sp.]MBK8454111.1 hypothetical protein [Thiofilum sp.]
MQTETDTITLSGDLAHWISTRAQRNTRTPLQELTHMLTPHMKRERDSVERKAKRAEYERTERLRLH